MTSRLHTGALAASTALAVSLFAFSVATAAPRTHVQGPLKIDHPWIPPTPNAAPTAAGYLTIINTGKSADRLVGVSTPAADTVEPHHMSMAHGVMSMRPIQGGVTIGPGASFAFAPGGDHLMLIGLKHPLKPGQAVPATLRFEHAGAVRIAFRVERPSAGPPAAAGRVMH